MGLLSKEDEVIKDSFRRFKEHMMALEAELRADREFLIKLNIRIEAIEKRLEDISGERSNNKPLKEEISSINPPEIKNIEFEETEDISSLETPISNLKVEAPQERGGFLATPRRHRADTSTPFRHPGTDSDTNLNNIDIEEIKSDLNNVFFSLTNREFKAFMTIYSLEEQHNSPITYQELARHLDVSASSIRDYVSELVRKGTPIKKEKSRNGVIYVSVLPEFRALNLISKLIAFRNMASDQKSIFDNF